MKDKFRKASGFGILLLCFLAYLAYTNVVEKRVLLARDYPGNQEIHLPLVRSDMTEPSYAFYVQLFQPRFASKTWRIMGSGCIDYININSHRMDLSSYSKRLLCDLRNGRKFDFSDYLIPGTNHLSVMLEGPGQVYAINVIPSPDLKQLFSLYILPLLIIIAWSCLSYNFFGDWFIVSVTSIAVYLRYLALLFSNFSDRSPDWWGHIQYVRYMALYFNIPDPTKGWQYYHPPLYYYITGAIYKIADILKYDPVFSIRIFSFICILLFQFYGLRIIAAYTKNSFLKYVLIILLSFQPLMLILGGRVSNEILLYVVFAAFYFHVLEWTKNNTRENFNICLMLCAIGFLIKTSVIILILSLALTYIYWFIRKTIPLDYMLDKKSLLCMACICLALGSSFSRTFLLKLYDVPQINILVANHYRDEMTPFERTYNNWESFQFSLKTLIQTPNFDIFKDSTGRQNFWSSYVKSFSFAGYKGFHPNIMKIINILTFVFIIPIFLIAVIRIIKYTFELGYKILNSERQTGSSHKVAHLHEAAAKISISQSSLSSCLIICIFVALMCHIAFRLAYPFTTTHEARFTFPIFLCLLAFVGSSLSADIFKHRGYKYMRNGIILFCAVYALFSICYSILFVLKLAAP